jgi:hypothetical protein
MIALLRAILDALGKLLAGQTAAGDQAVKLHEDTVALLTAQSADIEHLRVLIEGDAIPTTVGTPTFTTGTAPWPTISTGGTP